MEPGNEAIFTKVMNIHHLFISRRSLDCPTLTDPANGMVNLTGLSTGDVASYTCNSSYFLSGTEVRMCEQMEWSFGAPTCGES